MDNVDLYGDIEWQYKNMGAYIHYPHFTATFIDCDNYANITNTADLATSYSSAFLGVDTIKATYYADEVDTLYTFTNCTYNGIATSGQVGMFIANFSYTSGNPSMKIVINDCKNYGEFVVLGGLYNNSRNYITADVWDKAYALSVSYDNGETYLTTSTTPKWTDLNSQAELIGEGGLFIDDTSNLIPITVNTDKTLKIDLSGLPNASYVIFHVTMNSSKVHDVYEKVNVSQETKSTIKDYMFVPESFAHDSTDTLNGYDLYVCGSDTYYKTPSNVTISQPTQGSVTALVFDSNNAIIGACKLSRE